MTSNDAAHAKAAAKQLGATLSASGAFGSVTAELPPFDVSKIAGLYMPYRFGLLAPADRAALADSTLSLHDTLARRLYSPLRSGLATQLADDPFGWLEHWLAGLPLATSNLEIEDGLLVAHQRQRDQRSGDGNAAGFGIRIEGPACGSQRRRATAKAR